MVGPPPTASDHECPQIAAVVFMLVGLRALRLKQNKTP
jgi:hypothetical protein